jgi:hypothetical protein
VVAESKSPDDQAAAKQSRHIAAPMRRLSSLNVI